MREVKKLMHHAYTPGEGVKITVECKEPEASFWVRLLARAILDCNRKRKHYGCDKPLTYCIEYVPGTQSNAQETAEEVRARVLEALQSQALPESQRRS